MKRRYHKAKFVLFLWTFLFGFGFVCCFFFYSRERKKGYRQLHYLQMDNLKLGTCFCTAQCLQTESIHGLPAARIKAGCMYILSPATKPGSLPSRGSISVTEPAPCSSCRGTERCHSTEVCPGQKLVKL